MPLPKVYQSQNTAIASYNYADLAENTGVQLFYGAATSAGRILTPNQIYAENIEDVSSTLSNTTFAKVLDLDYDLTAFNLPKTIRGTATLNLFVQVNEVATTGARADDAYIIARIRKWDGATETEIASGQSATYQYAGASATELITKLCCFTVTIPSTTFAKGEILRLTIEGWYKTGDAADTAKMILAHDPMNRDGTYIVPSTDAPVSTTQLKAWIPFDLDL